MKAFWDSIPPKVKTAALALASAILSAVLTRWGVEVPEFDVVGKAMGY